MDWATNRVTLGRPIRVMATALIALLSACGGDQGPYTYVMPEETGDGWPALAAESAGLDPAPLEAATNAVRSGTYAGVDSMLVVRKGALVHEAYFNDFTREKRHDLRSATKSITSVLVGIAIGQGYLAGVDQRVVPLLGGEGGMRNVDDRKRAITIEHLLTMTPGLACDDWDAGSPGNEEKMYRERDWVKFIFDLPMIASPGDRYGYCTGGVVSLGAALAAATGMRADAYAQQVLFGPLGIAAAEWELTPTSAVDTGGHIQLRPRDMAKVGLLFLRKGDWRGQPVVPAAWVERSTSFRVRTTSGEEYGYLWWRRSARRAGATVETFYALGNGGQQIIVAPSLDIVAVFTGSNYNTPAGAQYPQALFDSYVLAAVRASPL